MTTDELLAYEPGSISNNYFFEQVRQVNNARQIVINGLDSIVEDAMKNKALLKGKEVKLTITLKLEKDA